MLGMPGFSECELTKYQRDRYSYLIADYRLVQQNGIEKYIEEQQSQADRGNGIVSFNRHSYAQIFKEKFLL